MRRRPAGILITSRGEEAWLGREHCFKLPLGAYTGKSVGLLHDHLEGPRPQRQAGRPRPRRSDGALGRPSPGHAGALAGLAEHSAKRLTDIVEGHLGDFPAEDPAQQRLFATLRFVEETLPERLRPLLVPIGLHERYLNAGGLEQMAKTAQIPQSRAAIDQCLAALGTAGLVHGRGQARYELHPALTGFLRTRLPALGLHAETEAWRGAFVDTLRRHTAGNVVGEGGGDGSAPGRQPDGGANRCRGS